MTDSHWLEVAAAVLVTDEGLKNKPYKDTLDNWTIGVGYFIGKRLEDLNLSNTTIEVMLKERIETHLQDLTAIFGDYFDSFLVPRQIALLSMIYSMGKSRFQTFHKLIAAVKKGDWVTAAMEAKNSKWAKDVDPHETEGVGRDDRIAHMLASGRLHTAYLERLT